MANTLTEINPMGMPCGKNFTKSIGWLFFVGQLNTFSTLAKAF